MNVGFGLTPALKEAGRVDLWNNLKPVSKIKRHSRNVDKRPDPEGEAFIITQDFRLVFHTSKPNIAGWVVRKKKEFGLYDYDFYKVESGWLVHYKPIDDFNFEHINEGSILCSWIGYSTQIFEEITKQYGSMPRYDASSYQSREEFEEHSSERLVVLGEYISEINKGVFYHGESYRGFPYLDKLIRHAEMMRSFMSGKLSVMSDIEQLTSVPIEGIVKIEKNIRGESFFHLSYANADNTEKKYANALFEAVVDLRATFPSTTYKRHFFNDPAYQEHLKPIKDMINYFARYECHFKKERCVSFIHGRDPHSFTQLAANMVKFYLIYRKKRLAYTAYICADKINKGIPS